MPDTAPLVPFGADPLVDPDSGARFLTVAELATWTRQEIAADDPFALAVIDAVSLKIRTRLKQADWLVGDVPPAVRLIAIQVAKRTYLNPDSVIAEGGLGPIGGDRYVEEFARALEFTSAEEVELEDYTNLTDGDSHTGLWTITTTRGPLEVAEDVYVGDSSGSDWKLPLYVNPPTPLVP